jgi:replicative DNA helicase
MAMSDMATRDVVPEELASRLALEIWQAVDSGNGPSRGVDAAGAADAGQAHHEALCAPEEDEWWLRTGLMDIDTLIGRRVRPGWLVVVGAQSKVGKSVFAANILRETGIRGDRRPVYLSVEMSIVELQQRIEASETGVTLDTLMDPLQASDADITTAREYRQKQRREPDRFWIEEMPGATLGGVIAKIRLLVARFHTRLVIIDYIQIMQLEETRGAQSRQAQIGAASRALKALAGELGIVVVILSQLNADMFSRAKGGQAPRPAARDMRESKDLLNDANMVILIDRPEEHEFESFHDGEECQGLARIEVAAARSGKCGWRTVRWNGPLVRFEDLARGLEPPIGSIMQPRDSHYTYATDEPPF